MSIEPPFNTTFYSQIIDNLSTAIIVTDSSFKPIFMNNAAQELFGTSLRLVHQIDLKDIIVDGGPNTLLERVQHKSSNDGSFTYHEIKIKPPHAGELLINCTISSANEDEPDQGVIIEIDRIDRILRITQEEQQILQHATAREIARGLAHEVNNPLGGLRGAAQLLERELTEEAREYTRIIISEADRLQALTKNMLGPRALPNKSELNIHEILNHVIKLITAETGKKITILVDYDPSIPLIKLDRDQMIQAILNIVRNAWQATGDKGQIILRTRILRNFTVGHQFYKLVLHLGIIDNGPGVPENKLQYIFYPMVTGRSEGTGLGLTIAQSLVSLHGGLIECKSQPGETTFSILLPFNYIAENMDEKR